MCVNIHVSTASFEPEQLIERIIALQKLDEGLLARIRLTRRGRGFYAAGLFFMGMRACFAAC